MENHRNVLANVFTGILVVCAVIVTVLTVSQYLSNRQGREGVSRKISNWERLVNNRPVNIGRDDATLKIIEFSDYQCPYCKELEPNLQKLVQQNQAKVAIVRYDYPLKLIHEHAYKAAIASKCAAAQHIYEPYESELFQADLTAIDWVALARKTNVPDLSRFSKCIDTNETSPLVEADIKVADQIGIKDTPTLVINGKVIPGARSVEALNALISDSE